ncbi:uncharacterized protein LOC129599011 isoform X2 [Paramacrobiotus metropolitanus]|uniref:uncharacterized protein LOC129599011 isoform X2 n=1 Tax=Paramacrobiotus metropolitanus TaxID=2943436 RepID=UPI002445C5D1|nr:uncharacterized protein LOC129599011 isoform X2 [Paramacrobiotus metropolitanus]
MCSSCNRISAMCVGGLKCYSCKFGDDANQCQGAGSGKVQECPASSKVCQIGVGLRHVPAKNNQVAPVMGRQCGNDSEQNQRLWSKAVAAGVKMICEMIPRSEKDAGLRGIDRRCVCATDTCNGEIWDEVMVVPCMKTNWKDGEDPETATLGTNSLNNVNDRLNKGEDGLGLGAIIGIAVGAVLFLALMAFVVWYMFLRKKKEPEEEENEDDKSGATSGASGRTWDEEEDPDTGLKKYKTELKPTD